MSDRKQEIKTLILIEPNVILEHKNTDLFIISRIFSFFYKNAHFFFLSFLSISTYLFCVSFFLNVFSLGYFSPQLIALCLFGITFFNGLPYCR